MREKTREKTGSRLILSFFAGLFALLGTIVLSVTSNASNPFCANSISCINNLSGQITTDSSAIFMGKELNAPNYQLAISKDTPVLGTASSPNKHIYVDLTNQKLYAFNGNDLVFTFPVSSGKWYPTPTGTFKIWIKLQATRMTGGSKTAGTYYDLPNVPWTMFFYNDQIPKTQGFSIHGAYWHNNFGHPMSHGCVNISPDNAKLLYDWSDPPTLGTSTYATKDSEGTLVTIFGATPNN